MGLMSISNMLTLYVFINNSKKIMYYVCNRMCAREPELSQYMIYTIGIANAVYISVKILSFCSNMRSWCML